MNRPFTLILITIILASCGEEHALKEETLWFSQDNRAWIEADAIRQPFLMTDDNAITQSYSVNFNTSYFNKGWSSFLGINTHMTHSEYSYIDFRSTFGTSFSFSLTAGSMPERGDVVYAELNQVGFQYDLQNRTLVSIDSPYGTKSKTITEEGYEENDPIGSTVEILDSLLLGDKIYRNVLHFCFNDFTESWYEYTPTDIYIAKGIGLIKYTAHIGLSTIRK
jgi:hypothetical protein